MNTTNTGTPDLSLRHLKAMAHVAKHRNLTRAANALNRSQTAVTKSVNDLESQLKVKLFDRSPTGMEPTVYGTALAKRVEQVEAEFNAACAVYTDYKKDAKSYQNIPIFSMNISYKRLTSIIVLHDTGNISTAAKQLGITRSAIYSSVRQLEELLELTLFEKEPRRMAATEFCKVLTRHIKLAFTQIRHALDDIASLNGVTSGNVTVGTLPYARTMLIPRAINHLLKIQPQLYVSTAEGTYGRLEASLLCGDIDFIVGAIRPAKTCDDLVTETFFEDRLSVIVRQGHPLQFKENLSLADLKPYSWVIPARNTPTRHLFDRVIQTHNLPSPQHAVETSSLSTVRGLLLESDRLALLSEHQIYYDKKYGILSALPIELKDTYRPIGVTLRTQTQLSPAAQLFLNGLREVAKQLTIEEPASHYCQPNGIENISGRQIHHVLEILSSNDVRRVSSCS